MSVYTELLRVGLNDEAARQLAEVATDGVVTKTHLDLRLAELEARLAWKIGGLVVTAMLGMTGLFAWIVSYLQRGAS